MGAKRRPKRQTDAKGGRPTVPRDVGYEAAGKPPDDPLQVPGWFLKQLAVGAHNIANDKKMRDKDRRAELRATARIVSGLIPAERLWTAEKTIRDELDKFDKTPDPPMDDATAGGSLRTDG